ncbi:DUF6584 family protein [Cellulomonas composti]|uniref:DUF6584 family protein n=1 Tax=Cellulomonas composti TaxID=266130 RepID=UPI0011BEF01E|nr:DUF6584 family protein [Cellulomonas composti]
MKGIERAEGDLSRGDVRKARDRLKGLLSSYPHDLEVRRLLAEAYRRDRQFPEAGRWGYLVGPDASDRERDAFERHCAFGHSTRITEARLRALLRCDYLGAIADEVGRDVLRDLPNKRGPERIDGPVRAAIRRVAALRARLAYR